MIRQLWKHGSTTKNNFEQRKLFFFGKLCKMDNGYLVNIYSYIGFSPFYNINRIGFILFQNMLHKHNLSVFFTKLYKNATFVGNPWKRIVVNAVCPKHDNNWQTRMNLDHDFIRFRNTHISMASVWTFLTNCSGLRPANLSKNLFHLYQIIMYHHMEFENVCVNTSLFKWVPLATLYQKYVVSGWT